MQNGGKPSKQNKNKNKERGKKNIVEWWKTKQTKQKQKETRHLI